MTFFTFSIGWQFIVGLPQKHIHQFPISAPDGFKWIQYFLFPPAPKGSASQHVQQISNKVRFCKHTCLHILNDQDTMGRLRSWGLSNQKRSPLESLIMSFQLLVHLVGNIGWRTTKWCAGGSKKAIFPHWPNAMYVGLNATSELTHNLWIRQLCHLSIDWVYMRYRDRTLNMNGRDHLVCPLVKLHGW